ncbi:MAG TPA: hypothetical protein VH253_07410 [Phycisphaerae bacterium]|nr:hypothetical protein [Phycisphaerae bacterium]
MIEPVKTKLWFAPDRTYHEAEIIELNDELMARQLDGPWWLEEWIDEDLAAQEIDRHWSWSDCVVEVEGKEMRSAKVGVRTMDGMVQGGMVITLKGIASRLAPGDQALLVEWLFTAPRNRPYLRNDGEDAGTRWYGGVGHTLLRWGAALSVANGYDGRMRLDASPDFVEWYANRGFVVVDEQGVNHEGVLYTPMELPAERAGELLES